MWLSEKLAAQEKQDVASADAGTVTAGGSEAAVYTKGEERNVRTVSPAGFAWKPKNGEQVLLIKGGTLGEEPYIVGKVLRGDESLAPGEVRISSDSGAEIVLRNSGRIDINGLLFINGVAYIPYLGG